MSSGILNGILNGGGLGNGILGGRSFMDAMASPPAAKDYQPGLLDGLGNFTDDHRTALLNMGAALLSGEGWGGGFKGYAQGLRYDNALRMQKQKLAETEQKKAGLYELASSLGHPELAGSPEALASLAVDKYKRREPTEWERLTDGLNSDEIMKARRYKLGLETKPATTDAITEYELAKRDSGFVDYQRSKKLATSAPSGYTFGNDGRLAPIPGGPQDPNRDINEPLPGEIAARFGLANEFFKRFDGIETDLKSKDPRLVGPIDSLGFGQSGALRRDVKLGSEAMIRMLTGAGMSKEEAANEVKQYLPDQNDNAATVLDKAYRLRSALRSMQREALQGRRSRRQIDEDYPEFESPDFEAVKGRVGGRKSNGQTRSGVSWSVR